MAEVSLELMADVRRNFTQFTAELSEFQIAAAQHNATQIETCRYNMHELLDRYLDSYVIAAKEV